MYLQLSQCAYVILPCLSMGSAWLSTVCPYCHLARASFFLSIMAFLKSLANKKASCWYLGEIMRLIPIFIKTKVLQNKCSEYALYYESSGTASVG